MSLGIRHIPLMMNQELYMKQNATRYRQTHYSMSSIQTWLELQHGIAETKL